MFITSSFPKYKDETEDSAISMGRGVGGEKLRMRSGRQLHSTIAKGVDVNRIIEADRAAVYQYDKRVSPFAVGVPYI